jgi:uncharacterized protein (DUF1684 family)
VRSSGRTADPQEHLAEVERWRARRIAGLTGPTGWLSVVGLAWLHEGSNTVGSEHSNDVVLPRGPALLGTIEVPPATGQADPAGPATPAFHPEPGGEALLQGAPIVDDLALRDDTFGHPTSVAVESVSFYLIRRLGNLGVRIKDRESPARSAFAGIEHYPVDLRWRFEARFEPFDPPRRVAVPTVMDVTEEYLVPGALAFDLAGETHRLEAYLEEGETELFIVFGDLTNGTETFGGGRYIYRKPPDGRGIVDLDFNYAYNPPCVFTPHATCPIPTAQNRLPIRVEAGEKRYAGGSKE